jgi:hypothetical protein
MTINIPWSAVTEQVTAFMASPVVANATAWYIGLSIGAFAVHMLLRAVSR